MKIKPTIFLALLLVSALTLAACGSTAGPGSPTAQSTAAGDSLSTEARLAIGTLQLAGSAQDISASQAAQLLTLWQAYQVLSNSDTTAQVELGAVIQQIQQTMTADQIQAIESLEITADGMAQYMQSAMPEAAAASSDGASTSSAGQPAGAPMDGSGAPPDGGMMGEMGTTGAGLQTAAEAVNQSISQGTTLNPTLLSSLLQMLEARAQAGN